MTDQPVVPTATSTPAPTPAPTVVSPGAPSIPQALLRRRAQLQSEEITGGAAAAAVAAMAPTNYADTPDVAPNIPPNIPPNAATPAAVGPDDDEFDESMFEDPTSVEVLNAYTVDIEEPQPQLQPQPQPQLQPQLQPQAADLLNDIRALREDNARLTTIIEKMDATLSRPPAAASPPATAPAAVPFEQLLSEQERVTYGNSLPVIQRVAEHIAKAQLAPLQAEITRLNTEIKQGNEAVNARVEQTQNATYAQSLELQVPDMRTLLQSSKAAQFLAKAVPYSNGVTIRQVLAQANSARNLSTVVQVMNDMRKFVGAAQTMPTAPSPVAATPQSNPITPNTPAKGKTLLQSKRIAAFRDFRAGRIGKQTLDKISAMYEKAEAEGRVNYDA